MRAAIFISDLRLASLTSDAHVPTDLQVLEKFLALRVSSFLVGASLIRTLERTLNLDPFTVRHQVPNQSFISQRLKPFAVPAIEFKFVQVAPSVSMQRFAKELLLAGRAASLESLVN